MRQRLDSLPRISMLAALALAGAGATHASTVTLPAAASIVGGAPFYSDVRAFNRSYTSNLTVTATYRCFIGDPCPGIAPEAQFTLGPRESRAFDDIVVSAFNAPDTAGGIEFEFDGDPRQLVVTSRLYSISPVPTVGMFIPGMLDEEAHATAVLTSIRNRGPGAGFRTNAGAFNGGDSPVSLTFRIFDGAGLPRGGPVNRLVGAHSGVQVSSIFVVAGASGFETDNAVITVEASGPVFSYAAVIDNATTDPIFVVGARDRSPITETPSRTATFGPSSTRTATRTGTQTTFTATATSSATPTAGTPTVTFTASQTHTPTLSPTAFTPSITPTSTRTLSPTVTFTASLTSTASPTSTSSRTPTITPTFTVSATPTRTATASPTQTFSPSLTPTLTQTASGTPTSTFTPTLTATPTSTPNPNHIVLVGQGGNAFVDSVSGTSTTTITAGTTVEWQWVNGLHSTTSGTCSPSPCIQDGIWNSGQHVPLFTFTRTFNVGDIEFTYFCTVHGADMQGLVIVLP